MTIMKSLAIALCAFSFLACSKGTDIYLVEQKQPTASPNDPQNEHRTDEQETRNEGDQETDAVIVRPPVEVEPTPAPPVRREVEKPIRKIAKPGMAFFCDSSGAGVVFNDKSGSEPFAPSIRLSVDGVKLQNVHHLVGIKATLETADFLFVGTPDGHDSKPGIYFARADRVSREGKAVRLGDYRESALRGGPLASELRLQMIPYGGSSAANKIVVGRDSYFDILDLRTLAIVSRVNADPNSHFNPRFDGNTLLFDSIANGMLSTVGFNFASGTMNIMLARPLTRLNREHPDARVFQFWDKNANTQRKVSVPGNANQPSAFYLTGNNHIVVGFEKVPGIENSFNMSLKLEMAELREYDFAGRMVKRVAYPEEVKLALARRSGNVGAPLLEGLWFRGQSIFAALPTRYGRGVYQLKANGHWERITTTSCQNGITAIAEEK